MKYNRTFLITCTTCYSYTFVLRLQHLCFVFLSYSFLPTNLRYLSFFLLDAFSVPLFRCFDMPSLPCSGLLSACFSMCFRADCYSACLIFLNSSSWRCCRKSRASISGKLFYSIQIVVFFPPERIFLAVLLAGSHQCSEVPLCSWLVVSFSAVRCLFIFSAVSSLRIQNR